HATEADGGGTANERRATRVSPQARRCAPPVERSARGTRSRRAVDGGIPTGDTCRLRGNRRWGVQGWQGVRERCPAARDTQSENDFPEGVARADSARRDRRRE